MSEIRRISISGFRSIAKIERLSLRPINVLIGPNGSGKSNFIDAFSLVHVASVVHMVRGKKPLHEYDFASARGADKTLYFGSKTTKVLIIQIEFGIAYTYRLELRPTENDRLLVTSDFVSFSNDEEYLDDQQARAFAARYRRGDGSLSDLEQIGEIIRTRLSQWQVFHFHDAGTDSPMKKTAALDDNRYLRPDGTNLAAFLYLLKERHRSSYDLIRRTVQLVAPFFDDFQLAPRALAPDTIRLEWRHKNSDMYFDVSSLSDGTLRFIALATLLLQPEDLRPSVILVDEPELGLHPAAITLFASLVKQVSQATQVILSTQSSLLVDHFEPEDVLVADRINGGTTLTRLSSDKLAAWMEDYSLGQLWEKGELGGRPAPE